MFFLRFACEYIGEFATAEVIPHITIPADIPCRSTYSGSLLQL